MRFISLLTALSIFAAAAVQAAPQTSPDPASKIQPALTDSFAVKDDQARVRVIVSLEAHQPQGLSKAQAIAESQGRVIGAFKYENNGQGLAVLTRYQTLFGFSAELTRGQVNALARRGDVKFLEEMPIHYKNYTESHPLTDVNLAHNAFYDGTGSVIAIIDDGIDASHPAFTNKLLGGYDFADNDNDPTIDCTAQSHGTSVAGVALGNGGGALGVAPAAKMVFLKIQGESICGSASLDGDVIGAIDWATQNKDTYEIDIISMSLGGGLYSSESACDGSSSMYFNAIRNATNAGITVIAASGNDGMCDSMSRPACFSDVISVGAVYDLADTGYGWCVNRNSCANTVRERRCSTRYAVWEDPQPDNVIAYSNSASFLDVVAPATCAKSAEPDNGENNGFTDCFGGTSSATPFTSGVAALAVQAAGKGELSPVDMLTVLVTSGETVDDPKNNRPSPRVNGNEAILLAESYGGPVNNAPIATFTSNCNDLSCSFDGSGSYDSDGTITSHEWTFGDGTDDTGETTNHTYSADGDYTVTLTVTDDGGKTGSQSKTISVSGPAVNDPPVAAFTFSCTGLTCNFTDQSSDIDGAVSSWSWDFGGDGVSTDQNPTHAFSTGGIYDVSLMVTDDDGATASTSQNVSVTEPGGGATLVSNSISVRNTWTAQVWWSDNSDISGTWSTGAGCSPDSLCELTGISKRVSSVEFTETGGETIIVLKP